MKNVKWLNEGYTVSLAEHGAKILANLSNNDLKTNGVTSEEIAIANTVVNRIQAQVNQEELDGPKVMFRRRNSLLMRDVEHMRMISSLQSSQTGSI